MSEIYSTGLISATEYEKIENSSLKQLYLVSNDNIADLRAINSFYTSKLAYEKLINDAPSTLSVQTLQSLNLNNYLFDNIIQDTELSKKAKDELMMRIPFAEGNVLAGQKSSTEERLLRLKPYTCSTLCKNDRRKRRLRHTPQLDDSG